MRCTATHKQSPLCRSRPALHDQAGVCSRKWRVVPEKLIQGCLERSHADMVGGGKAGSKKVPTAMPIWPGMNAASQYTDVPHSGQKCISIACPASLSRQNTLLEPTIRIWSAGK